VDAKIQGNLKHQIEKHNRTPQSHRERERKEEFLCIVNTNVQKKVEKSLLLFKIKDVAEAC
jgi:hypothetical protein